MRRGGFEIAARFAAGRRRGKQAGKWTLTDGRMQLIPSAVDPALTFVQHNLLGSRTATPGVNSWTIVWTAPAPASDPVQFNVAANASNNDDSPLGDYVYLERARSVPARAGRVRHVGRVGSSGQGGASVIHVRVCDFRASPGSP
jgi:hypothetical protein